MALMYCDGLRVWWSTRSKLMALLSSLVARHRFGCLLLLLGFLILYAVGSLSLFCLFLYRGLCVLEMVLWRVLDLSCSLSIYFFDPCLK